MISGKWVSARCSVCNVWLQAKNEDELERLKEEHDCGPANHSSLETLVY